jgi:hypothetical protein
MSNGLHVIGRILIKHIGERKILLRRLADLIGIAVQNRNGLIIVRKILLPVAVRRCLSERCHERHSHGNREEDASLFHCNHPREAKPKVRDRAFIALCRYNRGPLHHVKT